MNRAWKFYYVANARMPTEKAHGIQIAKMCEAFQEQGMDVELVVPRRRTVPESLDGFYGLRRAIPVRKLPVLDLYRWGRIGFLLSSFSFMLSHAFFFLWKRLRRERSFLYTVDLDQFSFGFVPFLGMPYALEVHEPKRRNIFSVRVFRCVSGLITTNRFLKESLQGEFGLPGDRVMVFPNGIDLAAFRAVVPPEQARARLGLPLTERIVLYVGKCYAWKGLRVLADVAEQLRDEAVVYLVGGTAEEFNQATGRVPPSTLQCVAGRPYPEVPRWLAAADAVLVLGTKKNEYSYRYTSPMKLFEYMAGRRPIVASRTPANQEVVSDAEALFYEPDDAVELALRVREALEGGPAVARRVARAAERVKDFSWERRAATILRFLHLESVSL